MSKRFIDTELFNDEWFMDLSKDCKLMWIYCITNCDHAGIISLNRKLCKFQTGINDIDTVIKHLGNRLVTLKNGEIFIPKFIDFQYPNFPNSNVRQQKSAIDILIKKGIFNEETLTVNKGLTNHYEYEPVIVTGHEPENVIPELSEFLEYAKEVCKKANKDFGSLKFSIEAKYESWKANGWKDGHNKKIKTWKTKFCNTLPYLKETRGGKNSPHDLEKQDYTSTF